MSENLKCLTCQDNGRLGIPTFRQDRYVIIPCPVCDKFKKIPGQKRRKKSGFFFSQMMVKPVINK